jgi:hypothetical protein
MPHHQTEKKQRRTVVSNSTAPEPKAGKPAETHHVDDEKSTADLRAFAKACFKKLQVKWPKATIASHPKN